LELSIIHFVTFSGGKACWRRAQIRLSRELLRLVPDGKLWEFTSQDFGKQLTNGWPLGLEKLTKTHSQGFGLWAWKPFIIEEVMHNAQEDDYIFYLDAGCTANSDPLALDTLERYLRHLDAHSVLAFQMVHPERNWTKQSVMDHYGITKNSSASGQVMATVLGVKVDKHGKGLIDEWCAGVSQDDFAHVRNPEANQIHEDFGAHRHDQSVWSCLLKAQGATFTKDETYFAPRWGRLGKQFPFWATRKCSGIPAVNGGGMLGQLLIGLEKRLSRNLLP